MTPLYRFFPMFLLALTVLGGCKESTLLPERFGTINGQVVDFATGTPLSNASVTTSPPSAAVLTDGDGRFRLESIPTGNYTITISRDGYQPNTATVSVQDGQETAATISLREEEEETSTADLDVSVLNFVNDVRGDTANVVRVQYRVANTGTTSIPAYEVYFRIGTDGTSTFFQEQEGLELGIGQTDIAEFTKEIFTVRATDVAIDDFWFEGQPLDPEGGTAPLIQD